VGSGTPGSLGFSQDIGFVIFGMPSGVAGSNTPGTWSGTSLIDATTLNGTNGFQFYSSNPNSLTNNSTMPDNHIIGDFDKDGFGDIVINDDHSITNGQYGRGANVDDTGAVFVIYGRPSTGANSWASAYCSTPGSCSTPLNGISAVIDIDHELTNPDNHCSPNSNCASELYISKSGAGNFMASDAFVADLNGDGVPDLLFSGGYQPITGVYAPYAYSVTYRWPETYNAYRPLSGQGFYLSGSGGGLPSWLTDGWGAVVMPRHTMSTATASWTCCSVCLVMPTRLGAQAPAPHSSCSSHRAAGRT
jgi:hypothetical protein